MRRFTTICFALLVVCSSAVPWSSSWSSDDDHHLQLEHHQQHRLGGPAGGMEDREDFDLEPTASYAFAGITTFARLPAVECLAEDGPVDDILLVGFPFDTATSYRTGTRFGPNAIRQGSRAMSLAGLYNYRQQINPFEQNISFADCGDFPISPFDNALAFAQMEEWYSRLLRREVKNKESGVTSKITGKKHPQIVALGGDHSISLPILRALHAVHGPMSAIHIDAHIDTWSPRVFAGARAPSKQAEVADGTPYYWAGMEGLLTTTSVHAGIRSSLASAGDLALDRELGFAIIPAAAMLQRGGVQSVIEAIRAVVPRDGSPVYVSLDVDSLDPAFAPGTAGPAAGGWTPREVIQIVIEALEGLHIVGVDVVEVLPGMDAAEITGIVAAELTFELLTRLVKNRLS